MTTETLTEMTDAEKSAKVTELNDMIWIFRQIQIG